VHEFLNLFHARQDGAREPAPGRHAMEKKRGDEVAFQVARMIYYIDRYLFIIDEL
jgi:hypothetical protein